MGGGPPGGPDAPCLGPTPAPARCQGPLPIPAACLGLDTRTGQGYWFAAVLLIYIQLYVTIQVKGGVYMSCIYARIKERRLALGLTVEQLAYQMGYKNKSSESKIENGRSDITQSMVEKFADVLGVSIEYLLGLDEC